MATSAEQLPPQVTAPRKARRPLRSGLLLLLNILIAIMMLYPF